MTYPRRFLNALPIVLAIAQACASGEPSHSTSPDSSFGADAQQLADAVADAPSVTDGSSDAAADADQTRWLEFSRGKMTRELLNTNGTTRTQEHQFSIELGIPAGSDTSSTPGSLFSARIIIQPGTRATETILIALQLPNLLLANSTFMALGTTGTILSSSSIFTASQNQFFGVSNSYLVTKLKTAGPTPLEVMVQTIPLIDTDTFSAFQEGQYSASAKFGSDSSRQINAVFSSVVSPSDAATRNIELRWSDLQAISGNKVRSLSISPDPISATLLSRRISFSSRSDRTDANFVTGFELAEHLLSIIAAHGILGDRN
jgi:hypothetical protein